MLGSENVSFPPPPKIDPQRFSDPNIYVTVHFLHADVTFTLHIRYIHVQNVYHAHWDTKA